MHDDGPLDPVQCLPIGVGAHVGGAVAEFRGEVAREHQVELLAVEPPAAQHARRLHEHDLAVAVLVGGVHVRDQLVAKSQSGSAVMPASLAATREVRDPA